MTPEEKKAYHADYYQKNRERLLISAREYKAAHPNSFKEYRLKNKERLTARLAEWRRSNPEKMAASSSVWAKENPDARRRNEHNRRARAKNNGGILSKGIEGKLFQLQRGRCACCAQPLGTDYHLDHIMPLALGGQNDDGNVQLLRARCNNQKYKKHPVDFMQQRGYLL